jgi:hypothetical protein
MTIAQKITLEKQGSQLVIRDGKSGRSFPLKGYGALKGQITFRPDVDLTKPIAQQVAKPRSKRKKAVPRPKAVA